MSNDVFGAKAFKQLDKAMIKYYKQHRWLTVAIIGAIVGIGPLAAF